MTEARQIDTLFSREQIAERIEALAAEIAAAKLQDLFVDGHPYGHFRFLRRRYFATPVIAGPADAGQVAHPFNS